MCQGRTERSAMHLSETDIEELKKQRCRKVVRDIVQIAVIGLLYMIWLSLTHIGMPCFFRLLTGWKCPGCGISHTLMALAHGKINEAYQANAFIFILMPFALAYWLYRTILYIRQGQRDFSKLEIAVFTVLLIAAIAFGVWRNL